MVLDSLLGVSAPAAVRKPTLEVRIDGNVVEAASTRVEAGLIPSVDGASLLLAFEATPTLNAALEIDMGYEDELTRVFTGRLSAICKTLQGYIHVTGINGGGLLSRLRFNRAYENQMIGDIVQDICGTAGIEADIADPGPTLAYFVLDDRHNALLHIQAMARRSGQIAYFTPEGVLTFTPYNAGTPVQTFNYGIDILDMELTESLAGSGVTVTGEGAAGGGDWSKPLKNPDSMQEASGEGGDETAILYDPALRVTSAVQSAAKGFGAEAARLEHTAHIWVAGAPAITPGVTIDVKGSPFDGSYLVLGMHQLHDKRRGYLTRIIASQNGGSPLGGLPL